MVSILHKLSFHPHLRGRDNLFGTIMGTGLPTLSQESGDMLTHSFWTNASLRFDGTGASDLMSNTGLIDDRYCNQKHNMRHYICSNG
jgi:hypothetical protein